MRMLQGFLLWAVASAALAQPFTVPIPPCENRPPLATLPIANAPIGMPEQLNGACRTLIEANTVGGAAAMLCPQVGKPPLVYLYAVRWSAVTPSMVADFTALGLPGDNKERIRAMQVKYQTTNIWDMCDVWGPSRERINTVAAQLTPVVGPLPDWVVAKNGPLITRPTFYMHPGTGLQPAPDTAKVGDPCDCSKMYFVLSGVEYCPFKDGVVNYQFVPITVCTRP